MTRLLTCMAILFYGACLYSPFLSFTSFLSCSELPVCTDCARSVLPCPALFLYLCPSMHCLSLLALLSWLLCPRTFLDVRDVLCILVVPSVCFHLFSYPTVFRYSPPCNHAYMCYCTFCIVHSAIYSKICLSTHKNLVKTFFYLKETSLCINYSLLTIKFLAGWPLFD
jgi:hypothetical protein